MGPISSTAAVEVSPKPANRAAASPAVLLSLICAATFVLYIGTAWFGFVMDDVYQVLDTAAIHSWRYFLGYFTTPTFATPYYRPLLLTWFRINDALFGTHAAGWHLSSVAAHVAVTALVYMLARRLGGSTTVALVAALIFGVHPIHIESAAWVSDACDPLCAIFFVAAFLAYLRGEKRRDWRWKIAAALSYALALLAKEAAVAFPAVVVAYTAVYAEGGWKDRLKQAAIAATPFIVMTAAYLFWHEAVTRSVAESQLNVSASTAMYSVPWLICFYLKKLFVPVGLSAFYDNAYVATFSSRDFMVPVAILAMAAATIWLWQRRSRDSRLVLFGAWWFILTLAPALDVQKLPAYGAVHDRYLYLPSMGFAILAALALEQLLRNLPAEQRRWAMPASAVTMAVVLCAINVPQQVPWGSDYLLYTRGVQMAPHHHQARNNLGRVLAERGDFATAENMFLDILHHNPDSAITHYNLGYTYYRQGRYGEAEAHLARAVTIAPLEPFPHLYLGLTAVREGKLDLGESELRRAVQMRPGQKGFHLALAYALEMKGNLQGALQEARAEVVNSGDNPKVRERVAELEAKAGAR